MYFTSKFTIVKQNLNIDKGGLLVGKTDRDGGQGIIVQAPEGEIKMGGGEIIINEEAAKKHCEELSKINQSTGGVAIPCDLQKEANHGTGNMEDGGKLHGKEITIPFNKLISYVWKLQETEDEINRGELSHSKYVPVTVSYVPDLKKYLLMDGNHRALELKSEGHKSIQGIINPYVPKTFNLNSDWKIQTISEHITHKAESGMKINNKMENNQIKTHVQYESVILETVGTRHYLRMNGLSWKLTDTQLIELNKELEEYNNPLSAAKYLMKIDKSKYESVSLEQKHDLKNNAVNHTHKNRLNIITLSWITTEDGKRYYKVFEGEKTHEDIYNFYKEKGLSPTHTETLVIHDTAQTRDLSAFRKYIKEKSKDLFSQNIKEDSLIIRYTDHGEHGFTIEDNEFELEDGSKVFYNSKEHTLTKILVTGGLISETLVTEGTNGLDNLMARGGKITKQEYEQFLQKYDSIGAHLEDAETEIEKERLKIELKDLESKIHYYERFDEYNAPKCKVGQKVYSYQNPLIPATIERIRKYEESGFQHAYRLSLPSKDGFTKNSNWIDERTLSKLPIKEDGGRLDEIEEDTPAGLFTMERGGKTMGAIPRGRKIIFEHNGQFHKGEITNANYKGEYTVSYLDKVGSVLVKNNEIVEVLPEEEKQHKKLLGIFNEGGNIPILLKVVATKHAAARQRSFEKKGYKVIRKKSADGKTELHGIKESKMEDGGEVDKDVDLIPQMAMAKGGNIHELCPDGTQVQTLIFDKKEFSKRAAAEWAKEHGFKNRVELTENSYRTRQINARSFRPTTLKTTNFDGKLPHGIEAVIGCLRSNSTKHIKK